MAVTIADQLGYKDIQLKCMLYKLLVYGEGHFLKHQDTEKEDGMIATLVIQSPSLHGGGDLVVYRNGEEKHRHDFGKADGTVTYLPHCAVHYADVEHAVEKVTQGYRLALVYSICLPPTLKKLKRNPNKELQGELVDIIETMAPGDNTFALLLSHQYTERSVRAYGSGAVKGFDYTNLNLLYEANAAVFAEKKLQFTLAAPHHHIGFSNDHHGIGDWKEDERDEEVTWHAVGGKSLGDKVVGDKVFIKFNFLNPSRESYPQLMEQAIRE